MNPGLLKTKAVNWFIQQSHMKSQDVTSILHEKEFKKSMTVVVWLYHFYSMSFSWLKFDSVVFIAFSCSERCSLKLSRMKENQ